MPTWSGILNEIQAEVANNNPSAFDTVRRRYLTRLAAHTRRNVILYATKWTQPGVNDPNLISINEEDVQGFMEVVHGLQGDELDLVISSPGGSPEAAEALVHYLRSKFAHIRVIVPHAAMSAATLVACAAEEIVMGKQSSLGPVDPQFILASQFGIQAVPAQAILEQFEWAREECKDPQLLGAWAPMLSQYGPALLIECQNALELAAELAGTWLRTYMFKGIPNKREATRKARAIAKALTDHVRFKSHGRHISRDEAREMGMVVSDLETDQTLQDLALSVYHATTQTFDNTTGVKIIENHLGKAFVKMQRSVTFPFPFQVAPPATPAPSRGPTPGGGQSLPPEGGALPTA